MLSSPELFLSSVPAGGGALQPVLQFFKDGGVFMVLLAITSLVTVAAIVFKILSLRRRHIIPATLESQVENFPALVRQGGVDDVLKEISRGGSTLARLCHVAVENRGRSRAEITEAVEMSARHESLKLNSGMMILDTVVTVAPLFGLLGTASGLVVIFQGLGLGDTTDHKMIVTGIGRALDNTIAGLAIAVPAVVAHGFFSRKIEVISSRLEMLLSGFSRVCENANPPSPSSGTP